jgi:FtsH-binding integral membrane protein
MERIVKPRGRSTAKIGQYDAGLRRHLTGVFAYMGGGLVLSAAVAFAVANIAPLAAIIFGTPLKWVAIFAPLALVMFASFRFEKLSMSALQGLFWGFSALMGVSLASALLVFTGASIVQAFLSAAVVFLAMALWGYTTKRDLSGWGSFLMIGLIGVVGASIVNLFLASGTLSLIVSIIGVIIFTGLTAWDMQRLRSEYFAYSGTNAVAGQATLGKLQVMGALSLYLNFINLFQMLLSLFGQRQEG